MTTNLAAADSGTGTGAEPVVCYCFPNPIFDRLRITKAWAQPSAQTFTIKPIRELVWRYVGDGIGWVDPFAGWNSPAEITNDWNPERDTCAHMDAKEFCDIIMPEPPGFNGVIFDPPYSYRQVSEHYKIVGKKAKSIDTTSNFYSRVKNPICDKIRPGGYAISCGWDTNGFGMNRGFKQIEILIVSHGGHHHDTLVTVERKQARSSGAAGEQQQHPDSSSRAGGDNRSVRVG